MDRYEGLQDYLKAKLKILKECKVAVLNSDDDVLASVNFLGKKLGSVKTSQQRKIMVSREILKDIISLKEALSMLILSRFRIFGKHNIANALASLAICGVVIELSPKVIAGLQTFKGLPHRSELVGTFKGTTFIDDSKATNISATKAGINACLSERKGVLNFGRFV